MKVFVAGSTGALGTPVVRQLLERGHDVFGLTRSAEKAEALRASGASPVVADVLDGKSIADAIEDVRPDAVLQLLNALPKKGPMRPKDIDKTNELRVTGTQNLLSASIACGVRRYVAESMVFGYGYGDTGEEKTELDTFPVPAPWPALAPALDALGYLERRILEATGSGGIESVILRFGIFYGPHVGSTEFALKMLRRRMLPLPGGGTGVISWIHVDDAASATVTALEADVSGEVFNVVDDHPASFGEHFTGLAHAMNLHPPVSIPEALGRLGGRYVGLMSKTHLKVSNAKIKRMLGWTPSYPSYREGVTTLTGESARAG